MGFIAKCYNGHKVLVNDELEGETIECPICEEDFIAMSQYEELGCVDETSVPFNTKGIINIAAGVILGLLIAWPVYEWVGNTFWGKVLGGIPIFIALLLLYRGIVELFHDRDPFWKLSFRLSSYYYRIKKKVKFYRR